MLGIKKHLLVICWLSFFGGYAQNPYPENFGELVDSDKLLLGKGIFLGDVGYATSKISFFDDVGDVQSFYRQALKINFKINPFRNFYIKNTVYIDLNSVNEIPTWLADYFYQIGFYNWRNKTFSYGYENYQPNRFTNVEFDFLTNVKRGFFFVSYNYVVANAQDKKLKPFFWDETSKLMFTPFFRVQPEFTDEDIKFAGYFKPVAGANLRYVIINNIFIESAFYIYPINETKLPWDPDYTYGFGVYDYRAFKINFSYGNWIANRFPWNKNEMPFYGFMNGEFSLSVTWAW